MSPFATTRARDFARTRRIRGGRRGGVPRARQGLTLIEVMVVMAVVAMAAGGLTLGLRALTRTQLRSACMTVAAAARYGYQRALTQGTTVRLTMDFEKHTFSLTETDEPISLVRSDSPEREEAIEGEDGDPGAALSPWEMAAKKIEKPLGGELEFPPAPFQPIKTDSGKTIERFADHPLGRGVKFRKMVVAHEEEPRMEGKVDLFFFPNGTTQHAVVQLEDNSETVFSVEIHPLTGHAKLHDIPYEPEVLYDDPEAEAEIATELEDDR